MFALFAIWPFSEVAYSEFIYLRGDTPYKLRKKQQPTPVFLPGESNGQRSHAGYSPWGRKELYLAMTWRSNHRHHTL